MDVTVAYRQTTLRKPLSPQCAHPNMSQVALNISGASVTQTIKSTSSSPVPQSKAMSQVSSTFPSKPLPFPFSRFL
jgi:hypothetical protein